LNVPACAPANATRIPIAPAIWTAWLTGRRV
jgi:hypothetical protein